MGEEVESASVLGAFVDEVGTSSGGGESEVGPSSQVGVALANPDAVDTEVDPSSPEVTRAAEAAAYTHLDVTTVNPKIASDGAFVAEWGEEARRVMADLDAKGLPANEVDARIKMLETRLAEAYARAKSIEEGLLDAGTSVKVMGLFTAPEWFFKNPGTPFTVEDRDKVYESFKNLSAQYQDMVIMPGTIVWRDKGSGKFRSLLPGGREATMANTSPVMLNGELVDESNKWLNAGDTEGYDDAVAMEKEMPEKYGGKLPKKSTANQRNIEYGRGRGKQSMEGEVATTSVEGDSTFFEAGGVSFSREICGDHSSGRRARSDLGAQERPADVHVLLSHGAAYNPRGAPVGQGGIGVHNNAQDGSLDPVGGQQMDSQGAVYTATSDTTEHPFVTQVPAFRELERGKMETAESAQGGTSHLGTYELGSGARLP